MTKSNRRLVMATGMLTVVGTVFYWLVSQKGDIVLSSDSTAWIAAVRNDENGSQAVLIDATGKIQPVEGWTESNTDRDVVWDPKGNRLFFISDRKGNGFQIFRYDAQRGGTPEQKSVDNASRNDLSFDVQDDGSIDLSGLVTTRGLIQEFIPRTALSNQVLPPSAKRVEGQVDDQGENTGGSAMKLIYDRLGSSFRQARWVSNRSAILAIMRQEDGKETLVLQKLGTDDQGRGFPPSPIMYANRFEMQVCPANGAAVFVAIDMIPPKGESAGASPRHGIFKLDLSSERLVTPVIISPNEKIAFGAVAVSPTGDKVLFVQGTAEGNGNVSPRGMLTCDFSEQADASVKPILQGSILEPSYSPDGTKIAFLKKEGVNRSLFICAADGTNPTSLTKGKGDYSSPRFSPQFK